MCTLVGTTYTVLHVCICAHSFLIEILLTTEYIWWPIMPLYSDAATYMEIHVHSTLAMLEVGRKKATQTYNPQTRQTCTLPGLNVVQPV